jgi:hypothetical protein
MVLKLRIMYMKTNKVSKNRRSKTEMGACAQHRSFFCPFDHFNHPAEGWQPQLRVVPLVAGGLAPTHAPRQRRGGKSRRENRPQKKMLKTKVEPTMYMKKKNQMTVCPTEKTPFSHNCNVILRKNTRILHKS